MTTTIPTWTGLSEMPTAPLRPCRTCGQVGCAQHVRQPWTHARQVNRIRGEKLQELRRRLFREHPLCVLCLKEGRTSVSTIRDHIRSIEEGGPDTEDNVQAICGACHQVKTTQESQRGVQRTSIYR